MAQPDLQPDQIIFLHGTFQKPLPKEKGSIPELWVKPEEIDLRPVKEGGLGLIDFANRVLRAKKMARRLSQEQGVEVKVHHGYLGRGDPYYMLNPDGTRVQEIGPDGLPRDKVFRHGVDDGFSHKGRQYENV